MNETNIILAVIGMVGLFATATIYQRANRITSRYYKATKPAPAPEVDEEVHY